MLDEELTNGEPSTPISEKEGFLSYHSSAMPTNGQKRGSSKLSISAKLFYPLSNSRKQLRSSMKVKIHFKIW